MVLEAWKGIALCREVCIDVIGVLEAGYVLILRTVGVWEMLL